MHTIIKNILLLLTLLLSACGTDEDPKEFPTTQTPNIQTPPAEEIPTTPQESSDALRSICDTLALTFDTLPSQSPLRTWLEGEEGIEDSTKLHWNPIAAADHYELEITFESGWKPDPIVLQKETTVHFKYDAQKSGYAWVSDGKEVILSSQELDKNSRVETKIAAISVHNDRLSESETRIFHIAKAYITTAPTWLLLQSESQKVALSWCEEKVASTYTIKYGESRENLDKTINAIPASQLQKSIESLTNESNYYFTLAAANANGDGKFGEILEATPTSNASPIDFAIESVHFNQAVDVDLQNNTNATPLIANKKGVLRIFVTSNAPNENQKVEILLGGSHNGVALTPIIKEVALSNAPFSTADSSNKALFFDIDSEEWLQEDTSFYIQIDPNNKIQESDETNNRYPATAEQSFQYETRHKMRIKLIPVLTAVGSVTLTQEIADGLQNYLEALYPLSSVEVSIAPEFDAHTRTPTNDADSWSDIIDDLAVYKNSEVANDATLADIFYYGVIDKEGDSASGLGGLASINKLQDLKENHEPRLIAVGRIDAISLQDFFQTAAHELGHNHSREHVDNSDETNDICAIPSNVDSAYPYNQTSQNYGRIAKSGYNALTHSLLEKNYYHDIMSYCNRTWISDYTYRAIYLYEKELDNFYHRSTAARALSRVASKTMGIMISGKISLDAQKKFIFEIKNRYKLNWTKEIPNYKTAFHAEIIFEDASHLSIPFFAKELDHSEHKQFEFFIPSTKPIKEIKLSAGVIK